MSITPASAHTQTCTLAVEVSESVAQLLGQTPHDAALHLKELALIDLFRRGDVSSGWAAEQLGITKAAFQDLLFSHDVPYFDLSEEELHQQVEAALPRNGQSPS